MLLWSVLLLLIPTAVGTLFFSVDKHTKNLPFAWISGQMTLWAGFEVIAVPFILREGTLTRVVQVFSGYIAVLLLADAIADLSIVLAKNESLDSFDLKNGRYIRSPYQKVTSENVDDYLRLLQ